VCVHVALAVVYYTFFYLLYILLYSFHLIVKLFIFNVRSYSTASGLLSSYTNVLASESASINLMGMVLFNRARLLLRYQIGIEVNIILVILTAYHYTLTCRSICLSQSHGQYPRAFILLCSSSLVVCTSVNVGRHHSIRYSTWSLNVEVYVEH
jgi:hypothetical protein